MRRYSYASVAVAVFVCLAWWVAPTRAQFGGGNPLAEAGGAREVDRPLSQLLNHDAYIFLRREGGLGMTIEGKVTAVGDGFLLLEKDRILDVGRSQANKMLINLKDVVYIGFDFVERN